MTRQTDPTSGSSKIWYRSIPPTPRWFQARTGRQRSRGGSPRSLSWPGLTTEVMRVQRRLHADGSIIRGAGCGALSDYRAIINRVTE